MFGVPQEFVNAFAKEYRAGLRDEWIGHSHGIRDWEYAAALYYAPVSAEDIVLDVGCGESGFLFHVAKYAACVWGVDDGSWTKFYERWLSTLSEIPAYTSGRAKINQCSAAALPFHDAMFDKVFTFSAFEHFVGDDDMLASREVARVLKPGGKFVGTVDFNSITPNPIDGCDTYTLGGFYNRIVNPSGLTPVGDVSIGDMTPTSVTALFFCLEKP